MLFHHPSLSGVWRFLQSPFRICALLISVFSLGCRGEGNQYVPPPPPEVTVIKPVIHPVTTFIEENGEIEAVERVDVRARVKGFIESIAVAPGQWVDGKTLLYKIEDAEYRAASDQAKAELASATASVAVANANLLTTKAEVDRSTNSLQRQATLLAQQALSQNDYDRALAEKQVADASFAAAQASIEAAQATVQQAQAKYDQALLDLQYASVAAPISGRITKSEVKQGDLVENGDRLATIVDDRKVYVNFSISDRQLLRLRDARPADQNQRMEQEQWAKVPISLRRETDAQFLFQGQLNYVDQEGVDPNTGKLGLRAVFDNSQSMLVPGLFVRVRMPIGKVQQATLVPSRAVLRDRVGPYVYVIDNEQRAQRVDVVMGQQSDGWSVIESGIAADQQVVIDGTQRLRTGGPVTPREQPLTADDLPASFRDTDPQSLANEGA
jgi:RND family efflux transporter MFP subunit